MSHAIGPDTNLSTSQVAKLLCCSPRTVAKWINAGYLPGSWGLPKLTSSRQGGDRRIPAAVLVRFCEERGIPVPPALRPLPPPSVLAGALPDAGAFFAAVVAAVPDSVRWSGGLLDAAFEAGRLSPAAVVLGPGEGLKPALALAEVLLKADPAPAVALVLGDDCDPADVRLAGLCWCGRTPDSWQDVVAALELTGRDDAGVEKAKARPRRYLASGRPGVVVLPESVPGRP